MTDTRQRILDAAIKVFASKPRNKVTMLDVAHEVDLTGPALYRYFKNRNDLYYAAVQEDLDQLGFGVLAQVVNLPAPLLTGKVWDLYAEAYKNHPLAVEASASRDPLVSDIIRDCASTQLILKMLAEENGKAHAAGILRQVISADALIAASSYMLYSASIPLILAGKYFGDEWFSVQGVVLAAALYPQPNWLDSDETASFVAKIANLGLDISLQGAFKQG